MKFVLDASVALKAVLVETDTDLAVRLRAEYLQGIHELVAPDFFFAEVGNALVTAERRKVIQPGEATLFFDSWLNSPPRLVPSLQLSVAAIELAVQMRIAVYDALYVVLALEERCQLVTTDRKLLAAFPAETIDLANI